MSITDTINIGLSSTDGSRVSGSSNETGTVQRSLDQNLSAGSTDVLVAVAWTVANTQAIMIVSTADATLKTNSTGTPVNTIALKAGIPLIWQQSAGYFTNPFTANVTAWFITCVSATRLQALILTI